jgi:hypothetical protein
MRTPRSILFLLIALLGCSRSTVTIITTPTAAQLAEFTTNAKISLPPSAQPLGWREQRGMDAALWLQVRLPAADLQAFLDASPFRGAILTTNDMYRIFDFREFIPTPPTRYRCGEQQLPNAHYLKMVVDESDTTNAVVYFMWHDT